jgi:ribosomal protein S3AE
MGKRDRHERVDVIKEIKKVDNSIYRVIVFAFAYLMRSRLFLDWEEASSPPQNKQDERIVQRLDVELAHQLLLHNQTACRQVG